MASAVTRRPCSMCSKAAGILTCNGCSQSFCTKHISDHRQALSLEMETISQEYDLLQHDLIRDESPNHTLFSRIDTWEQTSIQKLQQTAQQLRDNLRLYLNRNRDDLKEKTKQIASELQSSRHSEDYTEIELKSWATKLNEFRTILQQQTTIDLVDDTKHLIHLPSLKILHTSTTTESSNPYHSSLSKFHSFTAAHNDSTLLFNPFVGVTSFSVNRSVAKHNGDPNQSTMVCVSPLFSSEMTRIRFRVEQKTNRFLFFGILNSEQEMNRNAFHSPSLHGWMSFDSFVTQSRKILSNQGKGFFAENDELILSLNCKTGLISLSRPATNTYEQMKTNFHHSPLPWRVVVAFFNRNDSVRLIGKE